MQNSAIKVGGAALNQTPLDWTGNRDRILQAISEAQHQKVAVLCLPELCISGYGCEDAFHSEGVSEMAFKMLQEIIPHTTDIAVALGLPVCANQVVYNTIAWVVSKELHGLVAKQFLPGQDLYYETRWFKPWPHGIVQTFKYGGLTLPLGDLIFDLDGIRVGFEICEDAWVANRPATQLAAQGVDLILNASASHFALGQFAIRRKIVEEGARATNTAYVYSNLLGCEAGRIIYDGTVLIASGNQGILAEGPRFSFQDFTLTSASLDLGLNRLQRRKNINYQPTYNDHRNHVFCKFPWHKFTVHSAISVSAEEPMNSQSQAPFEEFSRAVALGLWDYLRKSRSQGFVVSISGGADSATVAVLIYLMANLALKELGWEGFRKKQAHLSWLPNQGQWEIAQVMPHLLLAVYQASEHSSETTHSAAEELCESIHARFFEFNISGVVGEYTTWLEQMLNRPLNWEQDDLALQNIQARVRGPSVWMLANTYGALLLSTSNRSEAAVGYATMDGDTCGGLSPIAGIDKAFILRWLKWVENKGAVSIGPLPVLKRITDQKPTAELRPQNSKQSDEDDLMPYLVLDAIERLAIRDRKMPLQVWQDLQHQFKTTEKYNPASLALFVERFFQLWSRNQWKRERYAPSFHLDDENLDPKTWCRFPILSGGFAEELRVLREAVQEKTEKDQ
ncbi:MAG: NAD(+) synthase [SAR324 cluster bacterium]|nr:NAD(+) synthase [SAR324 cluster bacterium]